MKNNDIHQLGEIKLSAEVVFLRSKFMMDFSLNSYENKIWQIIKRLTITIWSWIFFNSEHFQQGLFGICESVRRRVWPYHRSIQRFIFSKRNRWKAEPRFIPIPHLPVLNGSADRHVFVVSLVVLIIRGSSKWKPSSRTNALKGGWMLRVSSA